VKSGVSLLNPVEADQCPSGQVALYQAQVGKMAVFAMSKWNVGMMALQPHGAVAVVDDDPAVLDSLKFLLEVAGHTVGAYASADEFLEDQAVQPACLILDQHMPLVSGLDLAARLRTEGVGIPILLISGALSPGIVARAAQLGIERVLPKPPAEDDLLGFVAAYA
jgi:FixJ family two-component response regulator